MLHHKIEQCNWLKFLSVSCTVQSSTQKLSFFYFSVCACNIEWEVREYYPGSSISTFLSNFTVSITHLKFYIMMRDLQRNETKFYQRTVLQIDRQLFAQKYETFF